jgi:DNA replication and repair protein RecF
MINSLWIKSFRCLSEISLSFSKGTFISIISKNNVGKTSILEACYILGHLSSFVSSDISKVVPFDKASSYLGIRIESPKKSFNYYMKIGKDGKKYINLNEQVVKRKSDIQSLFRTVYISSDSLLLITSRPSFRRNQLDQGISQYSLKYRKNIGMYSRLVSQKNQLLKENSNHNLLLQINIQLAALIHEIQVERVSYLRDIEERIRWYYDELNFVRGIFNIRYVSSLVQYDSPDDILGVLNKNLTKEKMMRVTNVGPHRDDFYFCINQRNVKDYYSRGICRVLAYFFQLSQAYIIEEVTNLSMLMLLDEPFSEVYPDFKQQLIGCIPSGFDVIYTSTQTDEISKINRHQLYEIENGKLCKT